MDEMTGALVGLAALAGIAIGRAHGSAETTRVLSNQVEYLRRREAEHTGKPYTPPPPPPTFIQEVRRQLSLVEPGERAA